MNRITTLLASLAVALGLAVTIAPAAHADSTAACPTDVPLEQQVECLRAENDELAADNDELRADLIESRTMTNSVLADAMDLRHQLWAMADDLQQARQQTSIARLEVTLAVEQIHRLDRRVTAQRAKIQQLRAELRACQV